MRDYRFPDAHMGPIARNPHMSADFFEKHPLYRKYDAEFPENHIHIHWPAIHMYCPKCESEQTFLTNIDDTATVIENCEVTDSALHVIYLCAACMGFARHFFLKFAPDGKSVKKAGQYPSWDISIDQALDKALSDKADFYKKGLICESQGYGIAAFAYYRRVVEVIIDELITEISDLLLDEEKEQYEQALAKTKETTIAEEKIRLVKDLLPKTLKPDNINPLSVLYDVLSHGLHRGTDDVCLTYAMQIRESLVYLVTEVRSRNKSSKSFTESMRKLINKRNPKQIND